MQHRKKSVPRVPGSANFGDFDDAPTGPGGPVFSDRERERRVTNPYRREMEVPAEAYPTPQPEGGTIEEAVARAAELLDPDRITRRTMLAIHPGDDDLADIEELPEDLLEEIIDE